MYARWGTFAVGMGLMLAPLLLGYQDVAAILHDVAMGLVVCIATLAALEWPPARFGLALPAAWLVWSGRGSADPAAAVAEVVAGAVLLALAAFPSGRLLPRVGASGRDRASARA
jgi:hypothetical protein